jgi:hypothetical protein
MAEYNVSDPYGIALCGFVPAVSTYNINQLTVGSSYNLVMDVPMWELPSIRGISEGCSHHTSYL